MLGSQNKLMKSTMTSSKASTVSAKKDGFITYTYKRIWQFLAATWNRTRRFLWISSTGFILLVLPFAFAYISEFQREAAKIMGKNHDGFT